MDSFEKYKFRAKYATHVRNAFMKLLPSGTYTLHIQKYFILLSIKIIDLFE